MFYLPAVHTVADDFGGSVLARNHSVEHKLGCLFSAGAFSGYLAISVSAQGLVLTRDLLICSMSKSRYSPGVGGDVVTKVLKILISRVNNICL